MVGVSSTTSRDMLDHLLLYYGRITDFDLHHNWEICINHGTHSNLWNHYSRRFIVAWITHEEEEPPSMSHNNSKFYTPRSLQLESYTVLAAVGMAEFLQSKLRIHLKLTLLRPTASTHKYRGEQMLPPCQCSRGTNSC
jgi:hypothetical protein